MNQALTTKPTKTPDYDRAVLAIAVYEDQDSDTLDPNTIAGYASTAVVAELFGLTTADVAAAVVDVRRYTQIVAGCAAEPVS